MSRQPQASPTLAPPSVDGLESGRARARRRSGRRRFKNGVVSFVVFAMMAAFVGAAGYYLYEFYGDEQDRNTNVGGDGQDGRTTNELIDDLEDSPRWNGPGNPTFGVGDGPTNP